MQLGQRGRVPHAAGLALESSTRIGPPSDVVTRRSPGVGAPSPVTNGGASEPSNGSSHVRPSIPPTDAIAASRSLVTMPTWAWTPRTVLAMAVPPVAVRDRNPRSVGIAERVVRVAHRRDRCHITIGGTLMDGFSGDLSQRQQMAVACRTLAMQGYDDKLAGHVSVRDREDGTIIVPRVGMFWDEISPNDFVRIDGDGTIVEGEGELNPTIVFHLELHKARPRHPLALHNHPPYGTAWACTAALPPLYDQTGANGGGKAVVYSEYEGVVQTSDAAAALARAYGDADMAILTGHGTLVTASSVALALLRACASSTAAEGLRGAGTRLPGKPLLPEFEASAAAAADVYADMLMGKYARRLVERDPLALVDDLSAVTV